MDDEPASAQDAEPEVVECDGVAVLPPRDLGRGDATRPTRQGQLVVLCHNVLLLLLLNGGWH